MISENHVKMPVKILKLELVALHLLASHTHLLRNAQPIRFDTNTRLVPFGLTQLQQHYAKNLVLAHHAADHICRQQVHHKHAYGEAVKGAMTLVQIAFMQPDLKQLHSLLDTGAVQVGL